LRQKKGGYYDPPFKCRVPNSKKIGVKPYSPKGLENQKKVNKSPTKLAIFKKKI